MKGLKRIVRCDHKWNSLWLKFEKFNIKVIFVEVCDLLELLFQFFSLRSSQNNLFLRREHGIVILHKAVFKAGNDRIQYSIIFLPEFILGWIGMVPCSFTNVTFGCWCFFAIILADQSCEQRQAFAIRPKTIQNLTLFWLTLKFLLSHMQLLVRLRLSFVYFEKFCSSCRCMQNIFDYVYAKNISKCFCMHFHPKNTGFQFRICAVIQWPVP